MSFAHHLRINLATFDRSPAARELVNSTSFEVASTGQVLAFMIYLVLNPLIIACLSLAHYLLVIFSSFSHHFLIAC